LSPGPGIGDLWVKSGDKLPDQLVISEKFLKIVSLAYEPWPWGEALQNF